MKLSASSRYPRPSRLFALAAGLALTSVVTLSAWAGEGDGPPHGMPPHPQGAMELPLGPMLDHMLDGVKATPEQHAKLHRLFEAADTDLERDRAGERADRDQMRELMLAPTIDAAAVETVRARIEARHDAVSRRFTKAMVEAGGVLSAEQRQALDKHMHEMHGPRGMHDMHGPRDGHDGHDGHGDGHDGHDGHGPHAPDGGPQGASAPSNG